MNASDQALAHQHVMPLSLCFKGERDYLQGTDLAEAVATLARKELGAGVSRLQIAMHRFFCVQPDMHWAWLDDAGKLERPRTAGADFSVAAGAQALRGWISESTRKVDRRIDFDEQRITARCRLAGDSIAIEGETGFLPIEVAVSMTKTLHNRRYPAPAGRWIFTKLDLNRLPAPADAARLSIALRDNLHGRLTKSEIRAGGEVLGSIYFSLLGP